MYSCNILPIFFQRASEATLRDMGMIGWYLNTTKVWTTHITLEMNREQNYWDMLCKYIHIYLQMEINKLSHKTWIRYTIIKSHYDMALKYGIKFSLKIYNLRPFLPQECEAWGVFHGLKFYSHYFCAIQYPAIFFIKCKYVKKSNYFGAA